MIQIHILYTNVYKNIIKNNNYMPQDTRVYLVHFFLNSIIYKKSIIIIGLFISFSYKKKNVHNIICL